LICDLVPARLTHVGPIAANIRTIDRLECEALGRTPKDALRNGLRCSLSAYTAVSEGKPLAMLGVVPVDLVAGRGTIWMLGTEAVYDQGRALMTYGPRVIGDWLETFRRLENIISADNKRAIRMLRWWGFEFGDAPRRLGGVDFLPFWLERTAIQAARRVA
jgi:hypothetical protein